MATALHAEMSGRGNAIYRTVVAGGKLPGRGVRNSVLATRQNGHGQPQLRYNQHPTHSNAYQSRIPADDAKPATFVFQYGLVSFKKGLATFQNDIERSEITKNAEHCVAWHI